MFKYVTAAVSLSLALSTSMAFASSSVANLTQSSGKVLIDTGHGFGPADGLVSFNVGDKVFVGAEGAASVEFISGCTVSISESSTLVISAAGPCEKGKMSAVVGRDVMLPAGAAVVTGYAISKNDNDGGGDECDPKGGSGSGGSVSDECNY
jgi:hypothetical protein